MSRFVLAGVLKVLAERFPGHEEQSVELPDEATGMDLLRALHLAPDAHIIARGDDPIPNDEPLADGERILVIAVASGGV